MIFVQENVLKTTGSYLSNLMAKDSPSLAVLPLRRSKWSPAFVFKGAKDASDARPVTILIRYRLRQNAMYFIAENV